ncbi:MAG: galactose oxidase, partial [Proteobacteria bacterium]|nr:galactose oxidase [Pseudomonadota bacterium]
DTGAAFDPINNTWSSISTVGAPTSRWFPFGDGAVWAGDKMIVWGGSVDGPATTNTGGIYDPVADLWSTTSVVGAPDMRKGNSLHWTGSKMIVWGGTNAAGTAFQDGGIYDPATDAWSPISTTNEDPDAPDARTNFTSVLAGTNLIIWGGSNGVELNTGAVYNISDNSWTAMATTDAPSARGYASGVWTGSKMIVWGGYSGSSFESSGGVYDPGTNVWSPTRLLNAPTGRIWHSAFWTGTKMLIWGGSTAFGHGSDVNTGGLFTP